MCVCVCVCMYINLWILWRACQFIPLPPPLHHRIVPKPGADFYLFFSPFFSASFVRAGSRLATQPGADFHEGHACCRGYGRVVPPEQPPSRFSFFKKKLSPLKGMLYRICLSCTSRIPSFEVCVCLCLCLCLCVSYKLELYLQNNLLQGFSMSYVFFRPLSPVKGMPVVSPCRIFSIFCSARYLWRQWRSDDMRSCGVRLWMV